MAIRRDAISRNIEARKASVPTIAKGKPLDARGSEGDMAFRRTSAGLKLYIKANHKWHGVKVGESFDSLEKKINEIKSKVDTIKQFRLPSTYSVTGDFTLDASGDIELNADGGQVTINDGADACFIFDMDGPRFRILDDANNNDFFTIDVGAEGATTITTVDADTAAAHLSLIADGNIVLDASGDIEINADGSTIAFKDASQSILTVEGGAAPSLTMQSLTYGDSFSITMDADAKVTLATVDQSAAAGDIVLDADGNIELNADAGAINFKDDTVSIAMIQQNT